jgi:hypothetical protein
MFRFTEKRVAVGVSAVAALALAAGAYAYFQDTGSTTGSASVGSSTGWAVTDNTTAATLYPGQGSESLTGTVANHGNANQELNTITVSINAPTVAAGAPTVTGHACSAADFALSTASGSGWTVAASGLSATYSPAQDIHPSGSFTYGDSGHGLTLSMVDAAYNQNNCQGATANYSVAAS